MGGVTAARAAGFVGLAMDSATRLPKYIGDCALHCSMIERSMCSVQRIRELADITGAESSCDKLVVTKGRKASHYPVETYVDFPIARTGVRLENVSVAYQRVKEEDLSSDGQTGEETFTREFLEPALKEISAFAKSGEHIGVVGRTGAGTATLMIHSAIFILSFH